MLLVETVIGFIILSLYYDFELLNNIGVHVKKLFKKSVQYSEAELLSAETDIQI